MSEEPQEELRKVLVVDDSSMMRSLVGQIFVESGHRVIEAEDGVEAVRVANQFLPDLIVMDVNMPNKTGIEALRELRQDERFSSIAIVLLTSEQDRDTIQAAIESGTSDYILKDDVAYIRQKLQPYLHLLGTPPERQKCVLIVDDTRLIRHMVCQIFLQGGHRVIEAENGKIALEIAIKKTPDLIVMDVSMPVMSGISALKILRQNSKLEHIPVIMLTSEQDVDTVRKILTLGVTDYITKENVVEIKNRLTNYLNLM